MPVILHLETSTKNCSVAIAKNGAILALVEEVSETYSHAEKLHLFISYALEGVNLSLEDLEAVCVSKGPGSYTGLRIGVSAAKAFCFALKIPLLSIDSLTILAQRVKIQGSGYLIPMIDARRKEVYTAVFDHHGKIIKPICAMVLHEDSFKDYLGEVYIFGDGSTKAREILKGKFKWLPHMYPSARDMVHLSREFFDQKNIEEPTYFEPFYLKDFIVSIK